MRLVPMSLALLAGAVGAQTPPPPAAPAAPAVSVTPLDGGTTFISPMGEPFRSTDQLSGAEHWFAAADTNHDGRLLPAEFRADADRFFATLDTDHDGEIGPDEIEHYESVIAPEIRVASSMGDMSKMTTDSDGNQKAPPYPTRLGAGRYGYLDLPEPIIAADTNLDRAITLREFQATADKRFKILDQNGDGAIARDDLPRLTPAPNDKRRRKRR